MEKVRRTVVVDVGLGVDVTEVMAVQPVQSHQATVGTWAFTLSNNVAIRTEKLLDLTYARELLVSTVSRTHSTENTQWRQERKQQARGDQPAVRPGRQGCGDQTITVIVD